MVKASTSTKKQPEKRLTRFTEREFTLQVLFACEFNSDPWRAQVQRLEEIQNIQRTDFIMSLIGEYSKNQNELDIEIEKKLKNWDFNRIAVIDKIILRMAITELLYCPEIPPEVSINEAIELAKKYSTEYSGKFINGLLDAVYRELKKEKRIEKRGRGLVSKLSTK